ncbi:hypothetical protein HMPREF0880_04473 [Yokenella regensburgei ATCC 43003]|nr:hypothetical protein HMPREF0880_04473 [Yokenella regensburgei ATCC 43003]
MLQNYDNKFLNAHEITFRFRFLLEYARNQTIHIFYVAKWLKRKW